MQRVIPKPAPRIPLESKPAWFRVPTRVKMRNSVDKFREEHDNATIAEAVDIAVAILINNSRTEQRLAENLKFVGQQLSSVRTNVVRVIEDQHYQT